MLAGISLTCFTASYAVALALEATRMWFRSGVRGALMLGFAAAGLFAHTAYLTHRAVTSEGTPLSSQFDWYLIAAWVLAVVYFLWTIGQLSSPNERRTAFGLFLLPIVLALTAAAQFAAGREPMARQQASGIWIVVHLTLLGLGLVSVSVGFATGVMELMQASRLKQKRPPQQGLRLPSLEWLERQGVRSIFASFVLLAFGLLTGIILNVVKGSFSWSDPVVWRGGIIVAWLAAAAIFQLAYRPARQGRKVAYLTIVSFVVVVVVQTFGFLLPSQHGAPAKNGRAGDRQSGRSEAFSFSPSPDLPISRSVSISVTEIET